MDKSNDNKKYCPFCDPNHKAFQYLLEETEYFRILCDVNSIVEGHILIIPKEHIAAAGAYSDTLFADFEKVYKKVYDFIEKTYGTVSTFEHGVLGQTIFHSHFHMLPFSGNPMDIIPEGINELTEVKSLEDLKSIFQSQGQYLFFSIENKMWVVSSKLSAARFFRDRFANAIGKPEYGNWKEMEKNEYIQEEVKKQNTSCMKNYLNYIK
jgi:diadenosine tetraphosphate (Ap4A) HIT family hydrolase